MLLEVMWIQEIHISLLPSVRHTGATNRLAFTGSSCMWSRQKDNSALGINSRIRVFSHCSHLVLWLPWELSSFLDLPWFYKRTKQKTNKIWVILKSWILMWCSVPQMHNLDDKKLTNNTTESTGNKEDKRSIHDSAFPFTSYSVGSFSHPTSSVGKL